jgi:hypothetical protein
MIKGLLMGSIIGSLIPRTKKFTKKEVSDIRKKRKKEYQAKYANFGGKHMDDLKLSRIVEKLASVYVVGGPKDKKIQQEKEHAKSTKKD